MGKKSKTRRVYLQKGIHSYSRANVVGIFQEELLMQDNIDPCIETYTPNEVIALLNTVPDISAQIGGGKTKVDPDDEKLEDADLDDNGKGDTDV